MNLNRIATRIALPIEKFDFPSAPAPQKMYEELFKHLKIPVNFIEVSNPVFEVYKKSGQKLDFNSWDEFEQAVVSQSGEEHRAYLNKLKDKYDPRLVNMLYGVHRSGALPPPAASWLAHDFAHILHADDAFLSGTQTYVDYRKYFDVTDSEGNPVKSSSENGVSPRTKRSLSPDVKELADLAIACLDPEVARIFNKYESEDDKGSGFGVTMIPGELYEFENDGYQNLMPYFLSTLKPVPPIRRIPINAEINGKKVVLHPNANWNEFARQADALMGKVSSAFLGAINKEMEEVSDSITHQRGAVLFIT